MTRSRTATMALAIAGSSSSAMGAYHFFLPSMFRWNEFVSDVPPAIRWGLFSINFFFSFLLLGGGLLTFAALRTVRRGGQPDRGVLMVVGGFWLVNVLYQLVVPMPLPAKLWPLTFVFVGYAVVSAGAYLAALRALRVPPRETDRVLPA